MDQYIRQCVTIDEAKLIEVAERERNLGPAFTECITILPDPNENSPTELDDLFDLWCTEMGEEFIVHSDMKELLGCEYKQFLNLIWYGFGPISFHQTYWLGRNMAGHDILFRDDETQGYPIVFLRKAGQGDPVADSVQAIMEELGDPEIYELPAELENYAPDLIKLEDVAHAVYRRLEKDNAWAEVRRNVVNDLVYPDHLSKCLGLFKEFTTTAKQKGLEAALEEQRHEDDDEVITEEEKARLVLSYLEKAWW